MTKYLNIHPNLIKERKGATFDPYTLTCLLWDGDEVVKHKRNLVALLENDPNLQDENLSDFLSQEEKIDFAIKKTIYLFRKLGMNEKEYYMFLFQNFYPFQQLGFPLHFVMFTSTLKLLCSPEQANYWLPKASNLEILGCYAQTELGHGTFLKGLETTAVYDPLNEEFVLNTPTTTSMKWWSGQLGKVANYCIVIAQLYIMNKCYGIHPFILQIRSLEDHSFMPGVITGDVGPKMALNSIDNGFMKLDNVRIPRNQLLMKYDQVLKDGTYISGPNKKFMYATMMTVRCTIIMESAQNLAAACTIAVRYSVVRQQSEAEQGAGEQSVLNFQTQQYRLFSALSTTFALFFAWRSMNEACQQILTDASQGKTDQFLFLHSFLAGLKAQSTWLATKYIQTCRECCGGHGVSLASGLPLLESHTAVSCTYEGDNTVMILQTGKFLLKCSRDISQGKNLVGFVSYLNANYTTEHQDVDSNLHLPALLKLCQHRSKRMLLYISKLVFEKINSGSSLEQAFNIWSNEIKNMAIVVCQVYTMEKFIEAIGQIKENRLASVLTDVCKFYCAFNIVENIGDFLQFNLLTVEQVKLLKTAMYNQLSKIRPNAIALVDAFDFSDRFLHSALGRYDGQVYQALYDYAKLAPINSKEVHDSCKEYLLPFLKQQSLKAQL
ncbi:peroxisomal acyl-coenzyme A oxidase 1 isoform X1 [Octopus bimaculoides]|uniref:Acyl-coenzyme A oxidase n=1 Tax=Octopus bimaculoides TaxID=37653 RepID=A0A0L8I634_OCTBM|nr:peroxisomal acyl-coenzyme A oxidase 1 isoform X1 [Octopus bimaculoides]|eukprot:XP_014790575.1 PREDICTED: peroxisomal acyl-coenzyme A oxidase 1-like [Octopus bimaculoides]